MIRIFLAAAVLAALLLPVFASPVRAFPLSTCSLALTSTDASGRQLDTAQSGGSGGTLQDPFKVDPDGTVSYQGSTGVVITDYENHVDVFGLPTPLRGGDANEGQTTDKAGSVAVGSATPFRVAGLYYVSGAYDGEGGSCAGSAWLQLVGNPVGTVPWIAGVGMAAVGLLGLIAGLRGHPIASVLGGLLLGFGAALLLISHSLMPLAENTPLAAGLAGLVIGLVAGYVGRRRRGEEQGEAGGPGDATLPPGEDLPPTQPLAEA